MILPFHTLAAGGYGPAISPGAWPLCCDAGLRAAALHRGVEAPSWEGLDTWVRSRPYEPPAADAGLEAHVRQADQWWSALEDARAPWFSHLPPEAPARLTAAARRARNLGAPGPGAHTAPTVPTALELLGYVGPSAEQALAEDYGLVQEAVSGGAWSRAGWTSACLLASPTWELLVLHAADLERLYGPGAWSLAVDAVRDARARRRL